jgi:hypothetical protein
MSWTGWRKMANAPGSRMYSEIVGSSPTPVPNESEKK